ncbi:MAG: hypothetical protein KBD78_07750 [Oligoflexales bacterium]|nr:hypothetical protein [Oligoflexales bacterium]
MFTQFLLLLTISLSSAVQARTWECKKFKKFPVLIEGCEGEQCGILRYDKAIKDADLYASPSFESEKIDVLKKCEKILAFKPHILLKSLGSGKVLSLASKDKNIGIKVNDIVPITKNLGEGYLEACIEERSINVVVSFAERLEINITNIQEIVPLEADSWVRVTTPRTKSGYIKGDSFYMGFYTHDLENYCPEDLPLNKDHKKSQQWQ